MGVDNEEPSVELERTEYVKVGTQHALLRRVVEAAEIDTVVDTRLVVDSTYHHAAQGPREQRDRDDEHPGRVQRPGRLASASSSSSPRRTSTAPSRTTRPSSTRRWAARTRRALRSSGTSSRRRRRWPSSRTRTRTSSVTILRFANVLGPDVRTSHIDLFSLPAVPMILGFDPRYQFVHEDDVVHALEHVVQHQLPGVFNVAADGVLALSEVAGLLGKPYAPILPPWGTGVGRGSRPPARGRHPARDAQPAALRPGGGQPQAQGRRLRVRLHQPRGRDRPRRAPAPASAPARGAPSRTATSARSRSSCAGARTCATLASRTAAVSRASRWPSCRSCCRRTRRGGRRGTSRLRRDRAFRLSRASRLSRQSTVDSRQSRRRRRSPTLAPSRRRSTITTTSPRRRSSPCSARWSRTISRRRSRLRARAPRARRGGTGHRVGACPDRRPARQSLSSARSARAVAWTQGRCETDRCVPTLFVASSSPWATLQCETGHSSRSRSRSRPDRRTRGGVRLRLLKRGPDRERRDVAGVTSAGSPPTRRAQSCSGSWPRRSSARSSVTRGKQRFTLSAEDAEVRADVGGMVDEALAASREGNVFGRAFARRDRRRGGRADRAARELLQGGGRAAGGARPQGRRPPCPGRQARLPVAHPGQGAGRHRGPRRQARAQTSAPRS